MTRVTGIEFSQDWGGDSLQHLLREDSQQLPANVQRLEYSPETQTMTLCNKIFDREKQNCAAISDGQRLEPIPVRDWQWHNADMFYWGETRRNSFCFCIFFLWAKECWPLLSLCRPFCILRDVWIRTQSAAVASRRAPKLTAHLLGNLATRLPKIRNQCTVPKQDNDMINI
jgi:hypothetical protein